MEKVNYGLDLTWNCPKCKWINVNEINQSILDNLEIITGICNECNCEVSFNKCTSAKTE